MKSSICIQVTIKNSLVVSATDNPRSAITCSKLTIKTLEQGVKYVQS